MRKGKEIHYQGKKFDSHRALAQYLNISEDSLRRRLKSKFFDNNNLLERKNGKQNLIGKKFQHLTVIKRSPEGQNITWLFQCDCGKQVVRKLYPVTQGLTISCGHLANQKHHELRLKSKLNNKQKFNLEMKRLNELAQIVAHTKIGKRNNSGLIGVTKVTNYNQTGKKYVYWQASLNVNKRHLLKRFHHDERYKAIIQRGLWEQKYLGKIQPGIKNFIDNYLILKQETTKKN